MRKILWSYWDGPKNEFVRDAYNSWKKYLPDWDIRLLNKNTASQYKITRKPSNFDQLIAAKQSDVIRLNLLYNYGGLWLDATIVLNENLDWLVKRMGDNPYFGYMVPNTGYIENWLIMVNQTHNESIKKWRDLFVKVLEKPGTIDFSRVSCQKLWTQPYAPTPDYFDCYKTYCYLVKTDEDFKKIHESIPFIMINNLLKEPY